MAQLKLVTDTMTLDDMDLEELQSIFAADTSHRVLIGKRLVDLQARRGKAGWPAWLKANMPAGRSYSFYSNCMTEALGGKSKHQRQNDAKMQPLDDRLMDTEAEEIAACTPESYLAANGGKWWFNATKDEWLAVAARAFDAGYKVICRDDLKEFKPRRVS
jgi:hypothetical protein